MHGEEKGLEKYLASFSQHKFGRAFDAVFRDYMPDQVRADVRTHPEWFPGLTAIETDISWFHGDVRNCASIMEFKP
jgi:hypothetical protein